MKHALAVSAMLAIAFVTPASAQWVPLLPGWTAHEVPLNASLAHSPHDWGLAVDPISGDLFVAGVIPNVSTWSSILRVDALGQVSTAVSQAGELRPELDPVHRMLYQRAQEEILVYHEGGATLPPIGAALVGPIAAGHDGELYSLQWHFPGQTTLDLIRYDSSTGGWVPVMRTSTFPYPWWTEMPTRLLLDAEGTVYFLTDDITAFRIDGTRIVALGTGPAVGPASVGPGFLFLGEYFLDPAASGVQAWTRFAAPGTAGQVCVGSAGRTDGSVVFLSANPPAGDVCTLVVFTRDETPTVHRSWGALKSGAH